MNKGSISLIVLAIIALAILGGGAYAYTQMSNTQTADSTATSENKRDDTPIEMLSSMKDMMMQSVPYRCTYSFNDESGNSEGTVYFVNKNNVRVDFNSETQSGTMSGHFIMDGEYGYTWMDGDSTVPGMKYKVSDLADESQDTDTSMQSGFDMENMMDMATDMDCTPWVPNQEMLTPPADIEFMDMASMMESMTGAIPSGVDCSVCDDMPADMVGQCKTSLGCV